jgi:DNA-binding transcriptional ArsR family regulator
MDSHAAATDPFEALGDPNRRQILRMLAANEQSVGRLAAEFEISRPAVSRHLRLLREAGLVSEERRGRQRVYRLEERGAQAVREYLEQVWGEALSRFRLTAENAVDRDAATPR